MSQHLDLLSSGIQALGLEPSEDKIQSLSLYMDLLLKWNKVYNLTAIVKKEEIVTKHILDSLALVKYLRQYCPPYGYVLDAGSGAGFPGIPSAIFCPDFDFTLVDAVQKKTAFQIQAVGALKLKNVHPLHVRIESLKSQRKFNVIVSRAFASLKDFTNLTSHLLDNGVWLALKGRIADEELAQMSKEFKVKEILSLDIPYLDEKRSIAVIERV